MRNCAFMEFINMMLETVVIKDLSAQNTGNYMLLSYEVNQSEE